MAEVIGCPSCGRQLRVPEDLLNKLVKCPGCGLTFTAPGGGGSPPPPATAPPAALGPPPPREAVTEAPAGEEVPADPTPAPVEQADLEVSPSRTVPARGSEERGGAEATEPCPYCGEAIPVHAARCRYCGEDLEDTDEDDRPWERPGEVRRDWLPHRGPLILTLGIISISVVPMSYCCLPLMLASLGLGIAAWVLGHGDLKKMRANVMDPGGRGQTTAGMTCGIVATVLSGLCGLGQVLYFGVSLALNR